ncbi:crispr-associated recb family exonuclease cas4b / crispr-associated protein cas1 [hydrocarbon metagenome]|uniref:5' to 3' exodeoxyribonuclease (nucleoside 3'-phosphate-forming) n=1 Tax=hydrocarbon metagenome TaxID=938273 RepID=A0A0W8FK31_9ZZZZ
MQVQIEVECIMTGEMKVDGGWVPDLIPARMLNEYTYCPRLCYIEWVQGEFIDSADTVDGRFQHRRVDRESGVVPTDDEEIQETFHARSVYLSGSEIGITCRIDLLEGEGRRVTPIDYKRGSVPDLPEGAYEPERVQLCAQGLVLRENGFECSEGMIYFTRSKQRISVPFDDLLVNRTVDLIKALREMARQGVMPPPLEESTKCVRCSLAGICLPDEVNVLKGMEEEGDETKTVRKLVPSRDDQIPVYVVGHGQMVKRRGDRLEFWSRREKVGEAKLREVSQISLYGGVEITTPALADLLQRGVPVCHFSHGGWFYGISQGNFHKNVELRIRQFERAIDSARSLAIARQFVSGKIRNSRTLIRRNDQDAPNKVLASLNRLAREAEEAQNAESLLGIEGAAAQIYFSRFNGLLKSEEVGFSFENRNKRPPKDPVNAVLSYLYGVMVKEFFVTLLAVGFDPYMGFFHQPRYGRPALALDLMEEFRPLIADSVAITLFNNGELSEKDFVVRGIGVSLSEKGKKTVVSGYERRMNSEITHPIFGYRVSYRRILEVQARLLARVVLGEIQEYPPFCTR